MTYNPYWNTPPTYDDATGGLITIDTFHAEVHEGEMYQASYRFPSVANNGTATLVFTTGTIATHTVFDISAGGACTFSFYEGSTATGGTAVPSYNFNRITDGTPLATLKHTPSAGTAGTVLLRDGYLPGGISSNPSSHAGAGVRSGVEYVLGISTTYMLNVVNISGGAVQVATVFEWYEEALS